MNRFIEAVKNMFRIEDLRNRVMFTLALLAVYRIGAHIPIPGINTAILDQLFSQAAGSVLGIFDLFSGGNFRRMTIFALGIMPYITSSIILQLLTVVVPTLEKLQKEGEQQRRQPASDHAGRAREEDPHAVVSCRSLAASGGRSPYSANRSVAIAEAVASKSSAPSMPKPRKRIAP